MTDVDDLVTWLRAQLDEEELAASAASAAPWTAWRSPGLGLRGLEHAVAVPGQGPGSLASIATASWVDAEHIARHDPARVLAEVDAKRFVIDTLCSYEPADEWDTQPDMGQRANNAAGALRRLALPYADRPGYREEWRP